MKKIVVFLGVILLAGCGSSEEEILIQRGVDEAIAQCLELDPDVGAGGIGAGCKYTQSEESFHTFRINGADIGGGFLYASTEVLAPLNLPARITTKIASTRPMDGYIEDKYGTVFVSWQVSITKDVVGTLRELVINLEVDKK
jgi:uncharacterized protein YceK